MTEAVIFTALGDAGARSLTILEVAKGPLKGSAFGAPLTAGRSYGGATERIFAMPSTDPTQVFVRVGLQQRAGEIAPGLYMALADVDPSTVEWAGPDVESARATGMTRVLPQLPSKWADAMIPREPALSSLVPPPAPPKAATPMPAKPSALNRASPPRAPSTGGSVQTGGARELESALRAAGVTVSYGRADVEVAQTRGIDAAVAAISLRLAGVREFQARQQ